MDINHLELFAGIGGFRKAIELLSNDFMLTSENIGFSEIDNYALKTYKSNFDVKNEIEIGDIVALSHNDQEIENLPNFNLLTGGFPCQSFSMMGKQKGFKDFRGNVFFQIMDIVKIKKPDFILLENVRNLLTHNKGETLKIVIDSLKSSGYNNIYYDIFNSSNFGLPQNRNRVFIFASKNKLKNDFVFNQQNVINCFDKIRKETSLLNYKNTWEILSKEVDEKYYLSDTIKPTILSDGSKKFKSKSEINQILARPLTATMAKMHRACQDNYYSDDYIKSENPQIFLKEKFSKEELIKKRIRRLTPKEAFNLQGFKDDFFFNAKNNQVSDSQLYKQAGNAVSINTVYAILYYLFIEEKLLEG